MSFWEGLGEQMGVNFVKNRTQFLLGVDFRQIRVRRGTEIVEFGDILAVEVVVGAMALL